MGVFELDVPSFGRTQAAIQLVCASLVALAAAGCSSAESTAPARTSHERDRTPLTIGYSRLRISLPVFVAERRGIFRRHGIEPRLQMYDTAQPMMQALVEGRIDLAGYTALPITYGAMLRSRTRLLFLTALVEDSRHRISFLLRRKPEAGREPTLRSIADLRGRRVGILPTAAYRAWLEAILRANAVDSSAVTIQPIEPLLQAQTLANGGVDALFTNDPAATAAIVRGVAEPIHDFAEVPRYLGDPFLFGSFNVREAWAREHPDEVRRLAAALDEAIAWIAAHPGEAKGDLRPFLPEAFRPHVERYPDARFLPTTETSEDAFVRMATQYREAGIIPASLDLTGLVVTGRWPASASSPPSR
ncbi:MAG: ABC transporter substrate-binding protein [Deltaproteobacteria bacterium]|nr:ABC transporter substrate-binding protein [Deltaproteobacteria bacterium]